MQGNQRLPETICQTYALLAISIATYLVGSFVNTFEFYYLSIVATFISLFLLIFTDKPIFLFIMAFCMGQVHMPVLTYLNAVNPMIVTEALSLTCLLFMGLTCFAFTTENYNIFAMYGTLYSLLSTALWIGLFNIFFFQNSLVEILLTYISISIFSIYVVVDTQYLMINSGKSPVQHAASLFLDFANLFVNILNILTVFRDNKKKR